MGKQPEPPKQPRTGKPQKGAGARPAPSREKRPLKTLERVLSKAGVGSRTEARSWIHDRRVTVNGHTIENPDHWVDLERDEVQLDGQPLAQKQNLCLMLYKPKGYLTTYQDPENRPTVYDLLKNLKEWVFPVGRLDQDTSGLLVLTNDTQLGERLTNPDYKVPKTYLVKASRVLSEADLQRLRDGVELNDGPTRPAEVKRVRDSEKYTHFEIIISEGRNRQVRRMVEALEAVVLKLVRVRFGPLVLGDLPMGRWRFLTPPELTELREACGLTGRSTREKASGAGAARAPRSPNAPPRPRNRPTR